MANVRPAEVHDLSSLQEIERLAGERFRQVGLPEVADDDPPSLDVLGAYASDGRSWVAVDEDDRPIGYVLVDVVDESAHIEQVTVHPDQQGRGVGRALVDQAARWALAQGMRAVTLTTFRQVPWNEALYRHLGFEVLDEDDLGVELRAVRAAEAAHGLDPQRRVCMRLDL